MRNHVVNSEEVSGARAMDRRHRERIPKVAHRVVDELDSLALEELLETPTYGRNPQGGPDERRKPSIGVHVESGQVERLERSEQIRLTGQREVEPEPGFRLERLHHFQRVARTGAATTPVPD